MVKSATFSSIVLTALLLGSCSDGTVSSGGGAGDSEENAEAVALITPLVGLYDLPDNWRGLPTSDAYLEIQEPADSGEAATFVYRVDTANNCVERSPSDGQIYKDPTSDDLFFDSFDFGKSVISIQGIGVLIQLTEDVNDIDGDNDFDESATLQAARIDTTIGELGATCP